MINNKSPKAVYAPTDISVWKSFVAWLKEHSYNFRGQIVDLYSCLTGVKANLLTFSGNMVLANTTSSFIFKTNVRIYCKEFELGDNITLYTSTISGTTSYMSESTYLTNIDYSNNIMLQSLRRTSSCTNLYITVDSGTYAVVFLFGAESLYSNGVYTTSGNTRITTSGSSVLGALVMRSKI